MADDATIEELTRAVQNLTNILAQGKNIDPKEVSKVEMALDKARKMFNSNKDATKKNTDAVDKGTSSTVRFAGAVSGTVRNLGNFANSVVGAASEVQNNQESFSSLNSSIDLAAGLFKTTGKVVGGVTDSFGEALKGIPVIGGLIGGFVSAAGKATAALAEATADVASQIGKQVTAQLDNAGSAFRTVAQSGALGADGMTTLANQAIGAGISFKDFADVTKNSSQGLAFAFGSATTGVDRFSNISKAMTPFRRELEAMGIGAKQQNEMTANYLKLQARTARVDQMSSAELAQGSANYAKELSTLARLTGVSVDEAEKELQGQLRNARFNGAIQDINERVGLKAGRNVEQAGVILTKQNEAIGKGFQDIMAGNALTDEAQGFILAAGKKGQEAVDMLQKGQISAAEATTMINEGMKDRVEALGGPGALAKIVGAGTAFDTVALGMLEANKRVVPTTTEIAKMGEMTKKSLKPQDDATKGLVDGQMAMRNFATEVNKITISALPGMGKAATDVATGMTKAMLEINKMITMGAEKYAASKLGQKTPEEVETGDVAVGVGAGVVAGAGTGAAIGSIIPGIGTAIGAAIGGIIGGLSGGAVGGAAAKSGFLPDWLDFDWGGKKAEGGPIKPGTAYSVGEEGPELLVSNMSGSVIPNNVLASMGGMYSGMDTGSGTSLDGVATQLSGMDKFANSIGSIGTPLDGIATQLSGMSNLSELMNSAGTPLDGIATQLSNMAGPAGGISTSGSTNLDAVANDILNTPVESAPAQTTQANTANALGEAQLDRLDQLVATMSRSLSIQSDILQASNR